MIESAIDLLRRRDEAHDRSLNASIRQHVGITPESPSMKTALSISVKRSREIG